MITTDIIMILSLLAFLFMWWMPNFNHGVAALTTFSVIALLSSVVGVVDDRWQDAAGGVTALILLIALLVGRIRDKETSWGSSWVSRTSVALLVTLSIAPLYLFPVTDLPSPSGEFPVGTRSFELTDVSRPGILAADSDELRRLLIKVWYPASNVAGIEPRPYFTEAEAKTIGSSLGRLVAGAPFLFRYIKHSMTNSYPDAALLENAKDLPVVMYSHGYTAHAGQNTALMEELASHGYVVYSIQHTYDSSDTIFPNGDVLSTDPALLKSLKSGKELSSAERKAYVGKTFGERYEGQVQAKQESIKNKERISTQSVQVWMDDRLFVLNTLQQGTVPASVSEVVSASNFDRTGEMGMSFGGSITGVLCMEDTRCAAAVNLDGGGYNSTPLGKNMPVPFLMLYSDFKNIVQYAGGDENAPARGFNDFSYERLELTGMRNDVYRMMVKDVKHLGVTDLPLLAQNPLGSLLFGAIDGQAIIQIQNEFVRSFFDAHLLGKDAGFPQAQYEKYRRWVVPTDISDVREWWLAAHPEDVTQRVVFETTLGEIELALYPKRAPSAVKRFLDSVSNGSYDGASFYRETGRNRGEVISVIRGRLPARKSDKHFITADVDTDSNAQLTLSPGESKTTGQDSIEGERGTLAYARRVPGTTNYSGFLINLGNDKGLDTTYTTFGRVLRGMRVLEQIQSLDAGVPPLSEVASGEILRAYQL